ncbi:MAG TPA: inorganic diphosphatase [archaeon]|nr:inorganic diphosphatase [archaeon]
MTSLEINITVECKKGSKNLYNCRERVRLERIVPVSAPFCYGFVPFTHHNGEELDSVLMCTEGFEIGASVSCRAIGGIRLEKSGLTDDVLVSVPVSDSEFGETMQLSDISKKDLKEISDFLEKLKGMRISKTLDMEHAKKIIDHARKMYGG